jgi:hypothetical protein
MDKRLNTEDTQNKNVSSDKWNYIIKKVVISKTLPLILLLIFFDEIFYRTYEKSGNTFFILIIFKLVLGFILGIFAGLYEWKFNERLKNGFYKNINNIKRDYILNYGILGFGLIIGICYIRYPISITGTIINILLWLLWGVVFGVYLWRSAKKKFEKFI